VFDRKLDEQHAAWLLRIRLLRERSPDGNYILNAIFRILMQNTPREAAQHGLAADGALRPQDRCDFETRNQPNRFPALSVRRR